MARIWCQKHQKISNAYPEWNKKRTKILYFESKCGCKFKENKIEDIKVHYKTRYFLKDGTELIKPLIPIQWIAKKPKNG